MEKPQRSCGCWLWMMRPEAFQTVGDQWVLPLFRISIGPKTHTHTQTYTHMLLHFCLPADACFCSGYSFVGPAFVRLVSPSCTPSTSSGSLRCRPLCAGWPSIHHQHSPCCSTPTWHTCTFMKLMDPLTGSNHSCLSSSLIFGGIKRAS